VQLWFLLLNGLLGKGNPFCYVDTHAGLGIHYLQSKAAQKTLEYSLGISRLLDCAKENVPFAILKNLTNLPCDITYPLSHHSNCWCITILSFDHNSSVSISLGHCKPVLIVILETAVLRV